MPVPADYILGPNDELLIRVWGQIDFNARVVIDRNGQIYLPKVGTLTVTGLKYTELQAYLKANVGRLFKNFDLNVNLGRLRSIQVYVVGRARKPGVYTVGSLSTLVNALFASGGPDANGSMRHIQVRRQSGAVVDFDLYDLLVKGDKSKDIFLQSGDVIYIPPVGPQVAITGSVNLPGIYELRDVTKLQDQLETAGGLSTTADGSRVILERIENRTVRNVEEFTLDTIGLGRSLQDGDVIRVFPISPRFDNAVTLRGNVARPGRYPWREGMRLHDLIPSRNAIVTADYWARQNELGQNKTEWIDRTLERKRQEDHRYQRDNKSQADGSIPKNDDLDEPDAKQDEDQGIAKVRRLKEERAVLRRNPAEINWDYAVVQRLNPEDLTSRLIPFNLSKAIADSKSEDNIGLQPGDVITIFSQADITVPVEQRTKFVKIEGEVKASGIYRAEPGETLRDLVSRAGGFTPKAFVFASDFRRESTREEQQKKLEAAADQIEHDLRAKSAEVAKLSNPEDRVAALQQLEADRQALQRFRTAKATGRIVLDLRPKDNDISALPAIDLEDGDTLIVPAMPATVEVVGSVYNQSAFLFQSGMNVKHYLDKAGGATRDADTGRIFVIRADGSVVSKQRHRGIWSAGFDNLQLLAGDTLVVPSRIRTTSLLRELRDWSQVFAQFALGAAAIKVIRE
ncbi:MAG TPA: SLBB domain-containing protein [Terriglobales bacterium]|nr:SLBB domain-containing protein [Terriglobales bacterium]